MLALADAVQADYERRKQAEAALDYDDLIVKTQNLLSRADAAAWVLYKIDGGIDHILVDEAQDTNPGAMEHHRGAWPRSSSSGQGASDKLRTLFAVGDEKQSIYSFQGADPSAVRRGGPRLQAKGRRRSVSPGTRCRSTSPSARPSRSSKPSIACSARAPAADGLTWQEGAIIQHHAFRDRRGGAGRAVGGRRPRRSRPSPRPSSPGTRSRPAPARSMRCASASPPRSKAGSATTSSFRRKGRKVRAGDILILVRRRDPFTTPMIRELKRLARAGRRRRPHEADGSARGAGPRRARRRAADARGRPGACRRAQEPAVRLRRRRSVHARA